MSNRSLFWFWQHPLSNNIEYEVTEAQGVDSGAFAFQIQVLPNNAGPHLVVVWFAIRVEVCLSVVVGDRSLSVES